MARNKWKHEYGGKTLRSGFELKVAKNLDTKKVKYLYEESTIPYVIPETTHKYKPDFQLPNGVYVEAKGRFTPQDRRKMALVIEQNPDLDIRLLFMVDNTLSRASKTTYSDWATKRGIQCAVSREGIIPKEWLVKKKSGSGTTRRANKNDK